ncbi:MAG: GIY-YIG nuclease family protein, partial [Bacteroidota bacterium]
MAYVYILRCNDDSYYVGSTNSLEKRVLEHQRGEGAKHTKDRLPVELVYVEKFDQIAFAFLREKQIQGWTRKKKEALISGKIRDKNAIFHVVPKHDGKPMTVPVPEQALSDRRESKGASKGHNSPVPEQTPSEQSESRGASRGQSIAPPTTLPNLSGDFPTAIRTGIPTTLPSPRVPPTNVNRAPRRKDILSDEEKKLALRNALRYFPSEWHAELLPEFRQELADYGRIYMHRFKPSYAMHARPIKAYPGNSLQARAIMLMIQNNLDPAVAQHPEELITYGGNGSVFQNWAQYLLTMRYLSEMTDEQTL